MKFRLARHTTDLKRISAFYRLILGLEELGTFNDHNGYDGVFLGIEGQDWHLEFTVSNTPPEHHTDDDDLLVFYLNPAEFRVVEERVKASGLSLEVPKNPYWIENGKMFRDPDGFGVMISILRV